VKAPGVFKNENCYFLITITGFIKYLLLALIPLMKGGEEYMATKKAPAKKAKKTTKKK